MYEEIANLHEINIKRAQHHLERIQHELEKLERIQHELEQLERIQHELEQLERIQHELEQLERIQYELERRQEILKNKIAEYERRQEILKNKIAENERLLQDLARRQRPMEKREQEIMEKKLPEIVEKALALIPGDPSLEKFITIYSDPLVVNTYTTLTKAGEWVMTENRPLISTLLTQEGMPKRVICGICGREDASFHRTAEHITSFHWNLYTRSCRQEGCSRKFYLKRECERHELTHGIVKEKKERKTKKAVQPSALLEQLEYSTSASITETSKRNKKLSIDLPAEADVVQDVNDLTDEVVISDYAPVFVGTYSHIYKGLYRNEMVAVKVLRPLSVKPETMRRKTTRERKVWQTLDHPNIVPLYGHTKEGELFGPLGSLITPWYSNGDATRYLKEHQSLTMDERICLWRSIVNGVCYLHDHIPVIIHGDLKPGNILIDDEGNPRICDFGLAHMFLQEGHSGLTTTSEHTGTERYLAPELIISEDRPTVASDVYALGCIGLEVLFQRFPYGERKNTRPGLILNDIRNGMPPAVRPVDTDIVTSGLWDVLEPCWNFIPGSRPNVAALIESLAKF